MKVPPLTERPVTEEEEQDSHSRHHAARSVLWLPGEQHYARGRAGYHHRAGGCGSCTAYRREHARGTIAPAPRNTHRAPAPMPSASSEPPMSGGYATGPDGVSSPS